MSRAKRRSRHVDGGTDDDARWAAWRAPRPLRAERPVEAGGRPPLSAGGGALRARVSTMDGRDPGGVSTLVRRSGGARERGRGHGSLPSRSVRADRVLRLWGMFFQDLILALQDFWAKRGCLIVQPYNSEVGAGTYNPAT